MTEKEAYWTTHLAVIERLGVTSVEYARREGLSTKALYRWRARLKAASVATPRPVSGVPSSSGFIALRVPAMQQPALDPACVLALAPDLRLELAGLPAPEWVVGIVRALQRSAV